MRGSRIPRTVFSIKPQNGSKNFLKSTFFAIFHEISIFEFQNAIVRSALTCLFSYLSQMLTFWQISSLFSSRTLVAKALKMVIMSVRHHMFFLPTFFIFQNLIFQIIPRNPVKLFFQKNSQFPNLLSHISNFHDNINLEKTMP